MIDALESRRFLTVTTQLVGNTLFVRGDDAANVVVVTEGGGTIDVLGDGATSSFAVAAVAGLSLALGGGDDSADLTALSTPLYAEADLGDGDDLYLGSPGPNRVVGGNGHDSITGGVGDDTLRGEDGDDVLVGGAGADLLWGHAGLDTLDGGDDNDYLDGGDDADALDGGGGLDVLVGGDGDDSVSGGFGDDWAEGDAGDDVLVSMTADRDNDSGAFFALGGDGDDSLSGSRGDDSLDGGAGNDTLRGGDGFDDLFGGLDDGVEADLLDGGAGGDGLVGAPGDTLVGGGDADRFLLPVDLAARVERPIKVTDAGRADAMLEFTDDNADGSQTPRRLSSSDAATYGRWSVEEVKLADEALSLMQHTTRNVRLFKSQFDNRAFEFRKTPPESPDSSVVGSYLGGLIRVYGGNLGDFLPAVIAHEIGHDYDELAIENGWNDLSGWVQSNSRPGSDYTEGGSDLGSDDDTRFTTPWWYRTNAWFPTDYARTDPYEDFAESFEYFWRTLGRSNDGATDRWEGNPRVNGESSLDLGVRARKLAFMQGLVKDVTNA